MKLFLLLLFLLAQDQCQRAETPNATVPAEQPTVSQATPPMETGETIATRFLSPDGYERVQSPEGSFAYYLQHLPLKPDGSSVHLYNGRRKDYQRSNAAVVDLDVGDRDLQQCADAVMRLRAEYLYQQEQYGAIQFHFTNGFLAKYERWAGGERIRVDGNDVRWAQGGSPGYGYESFRRYLTMVFAYAGTLSLEKELDPIALDQLAIGDVFIRGGSPGHAVIVVDLAVHPETNKKVFLLAQSFMPAQDIHVLTNLNDQSLSPWYELEAIGEYLDTPEWRFERDQLRRW
jgi:hypothetical protein